MSLLTAKAVLSAGSVPLSLALAGLGKALEGREGLSCLGSFPEVIFLSPQLGEPGSSSPLDFPLLVLFPFSVFSHSSASPSTLSPSSVQIKGLKIKPPDPVQVGDFRVAWGHLRTGKPSPSRQRLTGSWYTTA